MVTNCHDQRKTKVSGPPIKLAFISIIAASYNSNELERDRVTSVVFESACIIKLISTPSNVEMPLSPVRHENSNAFLFLSWET